MHDILVPFTSDDDTLEIDNPAYRASVLYTKAAEVGGRPNNLAPYYKSYLERAGFVDVVEKRFKWPLNEWPKDPYYKELGSWTRENLDVGIEAMLMALFTRFLGWSSDEVLVFCAQFRAALERSVYAWLCSGVSLFFFVSTVAASVGLGELTCGLGMWFMAGSRGMRLALKEA